MRIGEIIREYRKKAQLTQEEVADFLGVSAPAVNKWENHSSYPDITLLAPLARLLKTDVDTLLSFRKELTEKEIEQITRDMVDEIEKNGYTQTFEKYRKIVNEYAGCTRLMYNAAVMLNMYLPFQQEADREKYTRQIDAWLASVVDSGETVLADSAAALLCNRAVQNREFEQAQKIIDRMKPQGTDKRILQANLYQAQQETEKVYKIWEGMVYQDASRLVMDLQQLQELRCMEQNFEEAEFLMEMIRLLTEKFGLAKYMIYVIMLSIACHKKDKEKALEALERAIAEINEDGSKNEGGSKNEDGCRGHRLYAHSEMNTGSASRSIRTMLRQLLEKSDSFDFLRDEPRYKRLCSKLDGSAGTV